MRKLNPRSTLALIIAVLSLAAIVCANPLTGGALAASFSEVEGDVKVTQPEAAQAVQASNGLTLQVGGQVRTGPDGKARLDFPDGTLMRVGPNSTYTLEGLEDRSTGPFAQIKLAAGQIWVILSGGTMEVETPSGLASVRGSYLGVGVDELTGQVIITCLEGICAASNDAGSVWLYAGQSAIMYDLTTMPEMGIITQAQMEAWFAANPEAYGITQQITETVAALPPTATPVGYWVVLPDLACIATGACVDYCSPPGWDPNSGTVPDINQVPQDCIDAANSLVAQGVDPEEFLTCVLLGGDIQICANNAVDP